MWLMCGTKLWDLYGLVRKSYFFPRMRQCTYSPILTTHFPMTNKRVRVVKAVVHHSKSITAMLTHCGSHRRVSGAPIEQPSSRLYLESSHAQKKGLRYIKLTLKGGVTNLPARLFSKTYSCSVLQQAVRVFVFAPFFFWQPGLHIHHKTGSFETCQKVRTLRAWNMYDIMRDCLYMVLRRAVNMKKCPYDSGNAYSGSEWYTRAFRKAEQECHLSRDRA